MANVERTIQTLLGEFDAPVRVGVIGAFSSGTTRMLETLLGCAGRLNVGEIPSTGNIVEFQLSVGEGPQTELTRSRVAFMSEQDLATPLLRQLLSRARGLIDGETRIEPQTQSMLAEELYQQPVAVAACRCHCCQRHPYGAVVSNTYSYGISTAEFITRRKRPQSDAIEGVSKSLR